MLHQPLKNFVPVPTSILATSSPEDVKRARTWIAIARKCGLVVAPWRDGEAGGGGGVATFGQDEDGRNNFSQSTDRFRKHPASSYRKELPEGLIYEVLCEDFGVDPEDQDLFAKVNARLKAEREERERVLAERNLLKLCRRAEGIIREDQRLEDRFSELSDSFMDLPKPEKPDAGPFPSKYASMSYADALAELKRARTIPRDRLETWKAGVLATGRFKRLVEEKKAYEAAMLALETEHGLRQADVASTKASQRTRAVVSQIAAMQARTPRAVAAKCRVVKLCLDIGWGLQDEFETLAHSVFESGELLHTDKPRTPRPPRSDVGQPAHI